MLQKVVGSIPNVVRHILPLARCGCKLRERHHKLRITITRLHYYMCAFKDGDSELFDHNDCCDQVNYFLIGLIFQGIVHIDITILSIFCITYNNQEIRVCPCEYRNIHRYPNRVRFI